MQSVAVVGVGCFPLAGGVVSEVLHLQPCVCGPPADDAPCFPHVHEVSSAERRTEWPPHFIQWFVRDVFRPIPDGFPLAPLPGFVIEYRRVDVYYARRVLGRLWLYDPPGDGLATVDQGAHHRAAH